MEREDEADEAPAEEDEGADPVEVVTAVPRAGLSVAARVARALKDFIQGDEPKETETDDPDEETEPDA